MSEPGMFESVLVANRGEIARRVFRTCRELGIRTIAIYTALDADAPHVRDADEAVEVVSYLDADAVVAAAVSADAAAIHPGYGFLSERAEFARAVAKAGLTWVGPTPEVIEQMGRKDAAREIAVAAGVPVVPRGEDSPYPLLVKAAAGGGGKGMRIVRSPEELDEARAAAAREALSAFGDETLLIEKYVERGRHIEVQVFGDTHGNVIHLFERDCSVQRRHQKVIEEAPAPTLTDEQRDLVLTSAVALARQVDYTGAGTVEFLLDEASGEAYFLEMNTRLQVEHPVTEEAVRIDGAAADLVALQLRVAAGEPLGIAQDGVRIDGHAIEVRVYAEDAFEGFLPQAGRTSIVRWPESARVEHALESEQVVSTAYDPMLAKVIVHGADREEARAAMVKALDATAVLGLTTNTGFLRVLAASDAFRDAEIDTAWLDRNEVPAPDPDVPRTLVAWVSAMLSAISDTTTPFRADGWRLAGSPAPTLVDLDRRVTVDRPSSRVASDGVSHLVRQISAADHVLVAVVDGVRHWAAVNVQPGLAEIVHQGHRFDLSPPDRVAGAAAHHSDGAVEAKMPGTVIDVRVQVGDQVEEGQVLGVLEAMKMEVALKAPFAGVVTAVGASAGSQVPLGAELFVVDAAPTE
ncbi:acetyl/propionyl/methylcrotonyl-CoA carboxylase subunit alpha [Nocardioides albus]|uniref:Acetyl/propionyl-CoA carboxylase alpha subunit n=1 Tax=Nocardioides albus TaxID=1841 RepID=A0A7W5A1M7_9ACTN|nr:biotin carboxylase N-terminal domain-containing protein [Nocardioides albus]MBB3087991.1 acetyl/propionyl-CoA carboxylase alpha subunit [Nocardioides albus]GGU21834.1 biotin carboxylase subunit of acetyl-CoA carboxylase [Nocardioides albus]